MTEYVGREWRKIRIPWSNRETICNDKIHPQDVSAEQVQEDRTAVRQTVRVTYNSQGGRRGRPWGWWGRRGWHLPLSTLLYLHWTPHPGGQITHTHTHIIKYNTRKIKWNTLVLQDIWSVALFSKLETGVLETVSGCRHENQKLIPSQRYLIQTCSEKLNSNQLIQVLSCIENFLGAPTKRF